MSFAPAQRVADAILSEGYMLHPYRTSAAKNQLRWQFGVIAPEAPGGDGEPSFSQTECLIERGERSPRLWVRVRGLRPRPVATAEKGTDRPWLEGLPTAVDAVMAMPLDPVPLERTVALPGAGIDAELVVRTTSVDRFIKLQLVLHNREPWRAEFASDRDAMLERSLVGAHLVIAVACGSFISLLEPLPDAAAAVDGCQNRHTWPVLVGDRSQRTLMLSSPIVLYDYPSVAKDAPTDLGDAAEIDKVPSLRILTMTDEEKRAAGATDPRARAILDRVEELSPNALAAVHEAVRSADLFNPAGPPSPDDATVLVAGRRIAKGSRVRLRPNRRADAMDMLLRDQPATVAGVCRDVDERVYVAVTVDIDPVAPQHKWFGRLFYFDPTEIEPIEIE